MKRYPKVINIIASEDPTKPNGVDFHMESPNGDRLESLVFSKDDEPGMGKGDAHEVQFHLVQESGMTLEFAPNLKDALWVEWGTATTTPKCPKKRPAQSPDPIFFAEKSPGNHLVCVNTNPDKTFFAFTLNFVDKATQGATQLIPFDPIGENQDGGINRRNTEAFSTTTVATIAVAAVAVLAIGYLLLK